MRTFSEEKGNLEFHGGITWRVTRNSSLAIFRDCHLQKLQRNVTKHTTERTGNYCTERSEYDSG